MKVNLTTSAIQGYADALAGEGLMQSAERLKRLVRVTHGFASKPLTEFLALLERLDLPRADIAENAATETVGDAIGSLRNLELVLGKASRRSRLDDLVALRTRLQQYESASLADLLEAVKVQRRGKGDIGTMDPKAFAEKLKDALGDEERFAPLFKELNALGAEGVARVTNALMSSGSSKSRKKDLRRILDRHEALRALNAKERAMAGRSAA